MPQVAGIVAAVAGALGVSTTVAAIGLAVVAVAAVSLMAQRAKIGSPLNSLEQPGLNNVSGYSSNVNALGPVLPHQIVYGEDRVGGAIVYQGLSESGTTLNRIIAFAGHEIDSIEAIYLDDQEVTLDGSGYVTSPPRYAEEDSDFSGPGDNLIVQITTNLGTEDQAADATAVANIQEWTEFHRLQGIAYVYVRFRGLENFSQGTPNVSLKIKGRKIEDPRNRVTNGNFASDIAGWTDGSDAGGSVSWNASGHADLVNTSGTAKLEQDITTVANGEFSISVENVGSTTVEVFMGGVSQGTVAGSSTGTLSYTASSATTTLSIQNSNSATTASVDNISVTMTYGYSNNPAMVVRDYLLSDFGLQESTDNINEELFETVADFCDDDVAGLPRFTCDGSFTLDSTPEEIIRNLVSSFGGIFWNYQGQWAVQAADWRPSSLSLTEDDLRGGLEVATRHSRQSNFNTVVGQYKGEETDWQFDNFRPIQDQVYLQEDNGIVTTSELRLPFTSRANEARRIGAIYLRKNRQQITVNGAFGLRALGVKIGDTVDLTIDHMGWTNKTFEVVDWRLGQEDGKITVGMILRETNEEIYTGVVRAITDESGNALQDESGNELEAIVL